MTITYSLDVCSTGFAGFLRLLLRWKGSIYKLVSRQLMLFAGLYYLLLIIHRFGLSEEKKQTFVNVCKYFRDFVDLIPLTFILGFYVSLTVNRWWDIYMNLPWVDRPAITVATYVNGTDERGRLLRRNMVRYLNLVTVLCLRCVSSSVKKRFPTVQHIVDSGLMTEDEKVLLESVSSGHGNYFQPALWFGALVMQARKESRIYDDYHLRSMIDEMNTFRGYCGMLMGYDWVPIPLVYTQVVSIAVYSFFFACLFGRQYVPDLDSSYKAAEYFPFFTFVQFFFYMGWLKVAEVLINPLGEDDEDLELNYFIDRNVQVGLTMVDEMHSKYPNLCRDPFWNETEPVIPYTEAAQNTCIEPFLGSANDVGVPRKSQVWANIDDRFYDAGPDGNRSIPSTPRLSGAFRKMRQSVSHLGGAYGRFRTAYRGSRFSVMTNASNGRRVPARHSMADQRPSMSQRQSSIASGTTIDSASINGSVMCGHCGNIAFNNPSFDERANVVNAPDEHSARPHLETIIESEPCRKSGLSALDQELDAGRLAAAMDNRLDRIGDLNDATSRGPDPGGADDHEPARVRFAGEPCLPDLIGPIGVLFPVTTAES